VSTGGGGGLRGGAEQGEVERGSTVQWGDSEAACSGGSAVTTGFGGRRSALVGPVARGWVME
jgi:hypothetical protein